MLKPSFMKMMYNRQLDNSSQKTIRHRNLQFDCAEILAKHNFIFFIYISMKIGSTSIDVAHICLTLICLITHSVPATFRTFQFYIKLHEYLKKKNMYFSGNKEDTKICSSSKSHIFVQTVYNMNFLW